MNSKLRRVAAALLVPVVFVWSVLAPRQAYAFAPVIGIPYVLGTTGSTYALAGLAGLIGLTGLMLTLEDMAGNKANIPLGPNPQNQPKPPKADPNADAVMAYCGRWYVLEGGVPNYLSGEYCTSNGVGAAEAGCVAGGGEYLPARSACATATKLYTTWGSSNKASCPSGYTQVLDKCVLNNPRQAVNDKACDMAYSNGAFGFYDDMNCAPSTDGKKLQPYIRGPNVMAYGQNSNGQPLLFEVVPGQDNWQIKTHQQVDTPTETQVKTDVITVDPKTGAITGASSSTSPGSITGPSGGTVPATDPGTTTPSDPKVNTDPTKKADIQFPDDYARRGEAGTAADKVVKAIDDFGKGSINVDDPTAPDWQDPWRDPLSNLRGWSVPGHSSQCPVGTLHVLDQDFVMDAHCQLWDDHKGPLTAAMTIVWTVCALFIVLRA